MDPKQQIDQAIQAAEDAIYAALMSDSLSEVEKASTAAYAYDRVNQALIPRLVEYRRGSVHQARQRMSVQELADKMGLTRSRIYQMLDGR